MVIAQRQGFTVMTPVVTNEKGRYQPPAVRWPPATTPTSRYTPLATSICSLASVTTDQLAHQLTNVDWWTSMPGTTGEVAQPDGPAPLIRIEPLD